MKKNWNKKIAAVIISTSLLGAAAPYNVLAQELTLGPASSVEYQLPDKIKVEVKSVLNERVAGGTRLGAVVRLYNQGTNIIRVPDYEVRMKTEDGVQYILRPSASNVTVIQPKEKVELSYLITVERYSDFSLSVLTWSIVDETQYPRLDTTVLSIPISSYQWYGDSSTLTSSGSAKNWGEPFSVPILSSLVQYTPIHIMKQNTPQGSVALLTLLAENKGSLNEAAADFRIDGKSDLKVYKGKRVEQDPIKLEPGEKKYVHYAIPIESKTVLKTLNVLTQETFSETGQSNIEYSIGRLSIQLPENNEALRSITRMDSYDMGTPIQFDSLNSLIQPNVDISLVEFHMHESEGDGYKTVIAKFKLSNHNDTPVPIPNFQAELVSTDGSSYLGTRQKLEAETLTPNLSYVTSYSFNVPGSEKGEQLGIRLMDGQTAAPYNLPIAAFQTQIQKELPGPSMAFYPFNIQLRDWSLGWQSYSAGSFSCKLLLDLEVKRQEDIVVDQNFSKMRIELIDKLGRIVGSETSSFTGANRLVTGWQTVNFNDLRLSQFEYPLTVNIYEAIDTPFGEAKRFIKTLKQ